MPLSLEQGRFRTTLPWFFPALFFLIPTRLETFRRLSRAPYEFVNEETLEKVRIPSFLAKSTGVNPKDSKYSADPFYPYLASRAKPLFDNILNRTECPVIPNDPHSHQMFYFLGYPDERSFLNGTEKAPGIWGNIAAILDEYQIDIAELEPYRQFAQQCYTNGAQKKRHSGENYICHPLRMIWHYVSKLHHQQAAVSPQRIRNTIQTMLLHDILEDDQLNCTFTPTQQTAEVLLEAENPKNHFYQGIILPAELKKTLEALMADDYRTYLQKPITDPTGIAAEVKRFDRLDNLLTVFKTSWVKVYKKAVETAASMTAIEWTAEFSHDFAGNHRKFKQLVKTGEDRHIFVVSTIADAVDYMLIAKLSRQLQDACVKTYPDISWEDGALQARLEKKLERQWLNPATAGRDLPELLSLKTHLADQYTGDPTLGSSPFGYPEIAGYVARASQILNKVHHAPVAVGQPYDYWQNDTFLEALPREMRRILEFYFGRN